MHRALLLITLCRPRVLRTLADSSLSLRSLSVLSCRLEPKHIFRQVKMSCGTNSCCGLSKEELKERLTLQQYQVTQERDTERPFSGKFLRHTEKGIYTCVVCGQDIFSSKDKFPSPCGWPAFSDVVDASKVKLTPDLSHVSCNLLLLTLKTDMTRTEVSCSSCGAHMGHLFDDGPKPTGKRYCINSAALDFRKDDSADAEDAKPV